VRTISFTGSCDSHLHAVDRQPVLSAKVYLKQGASIPQAHLLVNSYSLSPAPLFITVKNCSFQKKMIFKFSQKALVALYLVVGLAEAVPSKS
jgi:hypothetical protein